jgi:hypothetical protein
MYPETIRKYGLYRFPLVETKIIDQDKKIKEFPFPICGNTLNFSNVWLMIGPSVLLGDTQENNFLK